MTASSLNALSRASSSYLRSAMHQPVRWHEWGEEAFALARSENKPILLDIGAVWCHWCHVMDRESYDSPEIAQIVNERFVAVKVDRDERPDIDSRYQAAVNAISGQGGWPLTAFLTSEGKPFYGGTYFPPQDHYGRPSFKRVLQAIADAYRDKHGDVAEQARMVEGALSHAESFSGTQGGFSPSVIGVILESALKMFDPVNGGFGHAPKFPHSSAIDLVIHQYLQTGDSRLREVFTTTLEKMALGGVYDQLAGGFHRYSVDERWGVPHFEKMSYDNSELIKNYVHAFQATGSEFFAEVARDIIRWVDEWLSDRQRGGFYASQDADHSMEDDGDYFTWTVAEAREVLSEREAEAASLHYDINETGEMHHNPAKNVLFVRASVDEIAERMSLPPEEIKRLLASARQKLYAARRTRPTPYVDKSIYTGWNALCISAYLQAARALSLEDPRRFALRSLDRILADGWNPATGLSHIIAYSDPSALSRQVQGLLDDYAFTAGACLDAYEATADLSYFQFARSLGDAMVERFYDPAGGGFFDTPQSGGPAQLGVLGAPRKPFQDSPTPAGNPAAAIALLRLHALTDEGRYHDKAEETLELIASVAGQYGIFAGTYALAGVALSEPHSQIVIVGGDELADRLYAAAVKNFSPNRAILKFAGGQLVENNLPPALTQTLANLTAIRSNQSLALVCTGQACQPPISDSDELLAALEPAKNTWAGAKK